MGVLIGEEPIIKYVLAVVILVIVISGAFIIYDRWLAPPISMPPQPPIAPFPNLTE